MSVRNLQFLFEPRSVAVIGATENARHIGAIVLRNLIAGGFRGSILPVNPKYDTIAGLKNYRRIADLPQVPELALICTPPRTVAAIVGELGAIGTKAVIVHSGMVEIAGGQHGSLTLRMLHAAAPYLLRILGPDSVGLQVPQIGLNASIAPASALPGSIAFVSQSGALANVVLDWAGSRGIGFSRFVTLGQCADIDVADVLDYLARDACTKSILLYVEQIGHARKFMSAARAAARSKPTLVVRAGGRSAGDDVYDAAIRRAGMLRLQSTEELFGAVETLAWARSAQGERLSIVTNGGGLGAMAAHALVAAGGSLVALSDETQARLQQALPAGWSGDNPLDIADNAAAESYVEVMRVLLQEPESDAILFIHAPSALVASADIARAIVPLAQQTSRNILTCWPGGALAEPARQPGSAEALGAWAWELPASLPAQ